MATLPSLGLHACVGRTCKRQALVQRGLRGVDEGDGHLGILRGHESYAQSLYEEKKVNVQDLVKLSHAFSTDHLSGANDAQPLHGRGRGAVVPQLRHQPL